MPDFSNSTRVMSHESSSHCNQIIEGKDMERDKPRD